MRLDQLRPGQAYAVRGRLEPEPPFIFERYDELRAPGTLNPEGLRMYVYGVLGPAMPDTGLYRVCGHLTDGTPYEGQFGGQIEFDERELLP